MRLQAYLRGMVSRSLALLVAFWPVRNGIHCLKNEESIVVVIILTKVIIKKAHIQILRSRVTYALTVVSRVNAHSQVSPHVTHSRGQYNSFYTNVWKVYPGYWRTYLGHYGRLYMRNVPNNEYLHVGQQNGMQLLAQSPQLGGGVGGGWPPPAPPPPPPPPKRKEWKKKRRKGEKELVEKGSMYNFASWWKWSVRCPSSWLNIYLRTLDKITQYLSNIQKHILIQGILGGGEHSAWKFHTHFSPKIYQTLISTSPLIYNVCTVYHQICQ